MLNTNFCGIRSSGSGEEDFKGVCFTIYPYGGHLRHVTCIMLIHFHLLVPKSLHTQLFKNGSGVSEKSRFKFSYVNDLGPRSRNDLEYSRTFINSISCLHLSTFWSQAAIVSGNSFVSLFPIEKPKLQNLTSPIIG